MKKSAQPSNLEVWKNIEIAAVDGTTADVRLVLVRPCDLGLKKPTAWLDFLAGVVLLGGGLCEPAVRDRLRDLYQEQPVGRSWVRIAVQGNDKRELDPLVTILTSGRVSGLWAIVDEPPPNAVCYVGERWVFQLPIAETLATPSDINGPPKVSQGTAGGFARYIIYFMYNEALINRKI